jgi:carbonic anhydrase
MTTHPTYSHCMRHNDAYVASGQHASLPLGVQKRLVILTCMDSRILPEKMCGLGLGDAEIIRNGGGRCVFGRQ